MSKKRWRVIGVLIVVAVLAIGAVIALDLFPGSNRVSSNVYGDAGPVEVVIVSASRRTPARFKGDDKAATVQLGEHTARVTADRVELTTGRVVTIPAGCKSVELRESRGGLRVFLDGAETP
jgi:hypothetical protein